MLSWNSGRGQQKLCDARDYGYFHKKTRMTVAPGDGCCRNSREGKDAGSESDSEYLSLGGQHLGITRVR